ncbi:MAG: FAD-dependent oxidoreductase [Actinobacteria bacterium]|nr:FAD-dependent oxidoreductase [Actinomycetota bacterium]
MAAKVLVLGGNFAGINASLLVKHELGDDVDVTVVSQSDQFVFNPSLIWLPFGKRDAEDITFPLAPMFDDHKVDFRNEEAVKIDPDANQVTTSNGTVYDYDYLIIGTGYRNKMDVIPGLAEGYANTITTLPDAMATEIAWEEFLSDPGDVVVGATQSAGCFGAAYEFLFNLSHQLKKHKIKDRVKLTYVTSEPFLGHFGIGGLPHGESLLTKFLDHEGIEAITDVSMEYVDADVVKLSDGREIPKKFAMIVPPFVGQNVVKESSLSDAGGYVKVEDTWQSTEYDNVYAAGIAAAVAVPWQTPTPTGLPKTGFPTEVMARVAAANVIHMIKGEPPEEHKEFADMKAICVMDAGNNGVMILADKMLPPRKHGVMVPGPQNHAFKIAFEKYFMWKMKHGHVKLP